MLREYIYQLNTYEVSEQKKKKSPEHNNTPKSSFHIQNLLIQQICTLQKL